VIYFRSTQRQEAPKDKSLHTQAISALLEDDNISECSDVEEEGFADFTEDDLEPFLFNIDGMQLKPTENEKVKHLFHSHHKVKQMDLF